MKMDNFTKPLTNERGIVLVVVVMLLATLVLLGSTSLFLTSTDLKISGNERQNQVAFYNAEAGVQTVLAYLRNNTVTYPTATYPTTGHSVTVTGYAVPTGFSFSSSITLTRIGTNPNAYRFQMTGMGANNATKIIEAVFTRTSLAPSGADGAVAMYGGSPTLALKSGGGGGYNADGWNYPVPANPNCNGSACRTTGASTGAVPGLYTPQATSMPTTGNDGAHLRGDPQWTNTGGSHTEATWQAFVNMVLADPSLYQTTLGTRSNPAVTVVPAGTTLAGTANGAGILIVQSGGEFRMAGNSCFEGLVIVLGNGTMTATGTAIVYGSTITIGHTSKTLDASGTTDLYYSSEALSNLANISSLQSVQQTLWKDVQ
jgi:hypothetical protein